MQARTTVKMGHMVTASDAEDGEVRETPSVKSPWLRAIPQSDMRMMGSQSRFSMACLGAKMLAIQKRAAAPMMRREARVMPSICPSVANLDMGLIKPKKKLAMSAQMMAVLRLSLFMIVLIGGVEC